ncbi:MAG: hypothetical protein IJY25_03530 [Bacilli bacterium]|nr:hypothetical protein [Bacilli bacterium]
MDMKCTFDDMDNINLGAGIFGGIVAYSGLILYNTYKIHRDAEIKNVSELKVYEIKQRQTELRYEKEKIEYDILLEFLTQLKEKLPNCDYTNLNNNLSSLEIKKLIIPGGVYFGRLNKVVAPKIAPKAEKRIATFHELLHMSSAFYDENRKILFVGFRQSTVEKNSSIGRGLNEGYTVLLTERLFESEREKLKIKEKESYHFCKFYAEKLEQIVGQDKMQNLYFKSDLLGLIKEIESYDTKQSILEFINTLDFMEKNYFKNDIMSASLFSREIIIANIDHIQQCLIKWYFRKLKRQEMPFDEIKNSLLEYSRSLNDNLLIKSEVKKELEKNINLEVEMLLTSIESKIK